MNVKTLSSITASALLFAVLYYSTVAGKEDKCPAGRPLDSAEQKAFLDIMKTVKNAMAPAPEGWTIQGQDTVGSVPLSICSISGFPLASVFQVGYTNEKKILESIQKFERSRSAARMEKLAAEMSDAAERGDSGKLRKIQEEMDGLNATPAGMMTARIQVRINHTAIAGNIRGGSEYRLPGAKYAFLIDEKKGRRLVLCLGRWNRKGEYGIYPEMAKLSSNVSVQVVEVIIEGDIAEQLAKTIDLQALNSLMQ